MNNAAATLTLAGPNTYTGAATVTTGILKAGVASVPGISGASGGNSAVTMANTNSSLRREAPSGWPPRPAEEVPVDGVAPSRHAKALRAAAPL